VSGFEKQPTLKDKMHVVIFVVDGSTFDVMPEGVMKKFTETKRMVIDRGDFYCCLLHNILLYFF
jgi:hypothetical protein